MRRATLSLLSALVLALPIAAQDAEPDPAKVPTKPAEVPDEVAGALVLISYKDAPKPLPTATRTREEAKARAEEAVRFARGKGVSFDDAVAKFSDDTSNRGRVGLIAKGTCTVPALEAALFGMEVGQVSDPIESDFGFLVATRMTARCAASHILLMYKGSMRAPETVTRTREEAKALAEEARRRVTEGGEAFAKVASELSDCPSKAKGGNLGTFARGQMTPVFEDTAFALAPDEVSAVIETEFGFHVIKGNKLEKPWRASHILLMYKGAQGAGDDVTRSKEEAKAQAEEVLRRLQAGEDFAKIASELSDCGSRVQGGDLGRFGRGQMVPEFEKAVEGLQVGELSGLVESPFGYHIIRRTE